LYRLVFLGHLFATAWLFGSAFTQGRVLYFRDLSSQYAPDYAFLHRSLSAGVWPLWNPFVDGGAPCLFVYPVDWLLVWGFGPLAPLGIGAGAHLFLALCGGSLLAKRLGQGPLGAWTTGTVYGLSGYVLSCVNLVQSFQAAAWAPVVLAAFVGLVQAPSRRRAVWLAVVAAVQFSTLGLELALQTLVIGLCLVPWRRLLERACLRALALAAGLGLLMAAPAVAGLLWLLAGSARGQGFAASQSLAYSASPLVLLESLLPRFFGDVHAFSDLGYWGQPFFPQGFPYLLSLYLGPVVLAFVLMARPGRLHAAIVAGLLLSLGEHGPMGSAFSALSFARGPVKYFFLCTLAAAILAGEGLERSGAAPRRRAAIAALGAFGLALVSVAVILWLVPDAAARALGGALPEIATHRARLVTGGSWPTDFLATAAACATAALGLALPSPTRRAMVAAIATALDLLTVNGRLNPLTERSFYELRPAVAEVVREAEALGRYRWFSYGAANAHGLRFHPAAPAVATDVGLYYVDRQALLPRTQALDGLEGIFDADRTGWAPPASTFPALELDPRYLARQLPSMRLANVRWLVSFDPVVEEAFSLRATVPLPEVVGPLRLYELRDPLPRAFWVPTVPAAGADLRPGPEGQVRYERPDPHTITLEVAGPPGTVILLDHCHRDWRLDRGPGGLVPIPHAYERYGRLPTTGGSQRLVLRFVPGWKLPALAAAMAGAILSLVLLGTRRDA
jgi:hypothetical protein